MSSAMTEVPATYVTSVEELYWGAILVAVSLTMHAIGMMGTLRASDWFQRRFGDGSFAIGMARLILATWMITLSHLLQVMMWAGFFQWKHCFVNYSTAAYFALNEYTTVASALDLPANWRLLEGMIATAGLLGFAWSTGILFTLAQQFQELRLKQLERRHSRSDGDTRR